MPSRRVVLLILAFWLATTGFTVYRDVWPRLFSSGPPPVELELADEASPSFEVRWVVYYGDKNVGRLTTRVEHIDTDNTVRLSHRYRNIELELGGLRLKVPHLTTTTRVTRAGELREQTMEGELKAYLGRRELVTAEAKVVGRVEAGRFVGRCDLRSTLLNVQQELEPVPVPQGQALNPLMVMNRIGNVRPGQRWVVREVNPLRDAVAVLAKEQVGKLGFRLPEVPREELVAEVLSEPKPLPWKGADVSCWVIEYRGREVVAKTWVRQADGKVLRQEAFGMGERLAVERDE